MGMTYARIQVSKGRHGRSQRLRLLVDMGSDYTVLPWRFLVHQGVEPEFDEDIEIGNGEVIVRPIGRLHIRWRDRRAETFVAFGEPRDARVLGALSLEQLRLEVDPKSRKVRPLRRARFVRLGG